MSFADIVHEVWSTCQLGRSWDLVRFYGRIMAMKEAEEYDRKRGPIPLVSSFPIELQEEILDQLDMDEFLDYLRLDPVLNKTVRYICLDPKYDNFRLRYINRADCYDTDPLHVSHTVLMISNETLSLGYGDIVIKKLEQLPRSCFTRIVISNHEVDAERKTRRPHLSKFVRSVQQSSLNMQNIRIYPVGAFGLENIIELDFNLVRLNNLKDLVIQGSSFSKLTPKICARQLRKLETLEIFDCSSSALQLIFGLTDGESIAPFEKLKGLSILSHIDDMHTDLTQRRHKHELISFEGYRCDQVFPKLEYAGFTHVADFKNVCFGEKLRCLHIAMPSKEEGAHQSRFEFSNVYAPGIKHCTICFDLESRPEVRPVNMGIRGMFIPNVTPYCSMH